jgi:mxaD protein
VALVLLVTLYGLMPLLERSKSPPRTPGPAARIPSPRERISSMTRPAAVALALALLITSATPLFAHGPTPRKVEERIEIALPPQAVWNAIKHFAGVSGWHPGITRSEAQGGNAPGATRSLTLASGGVLNEGLDEVNEAEMCLGYRLAKENLEALPVSFYSATLSVLPKRSGSEVEWIARFYRGDTSNFPPEHLNDEAAVRAMTAFVRDGLEGLKRKLEARQ